MTTSLSTVRRAARRAPLAGAALVASAALLLAGCGDDVVDDDVEQEVEDVGEDVEDAGEEVGDEVEQEVQEEETDG